MFFWTVQQHFFQMITMLSEKKIGAEISAIGYWIIVNGFEFKELSNKLLAKGVSLKKKSRIDYQSFRKLNLYH